MGNSPNQSTYRDDDVDVDNWNKASFDEDPEIPYVSIQVDDAEVRSLFPGPD